MKIAKNQMLVLLCLLVINPVPYPSVDAEPVRQEKIETCEQLLSAVNAKMKEMNYSPFNMDELTVCLAQHASLSRSYDGTLQPRVQPFLMDLVAKKKFEYPVEVSIIQSDGIRMDDEQQLALPPYVWLEVAILNVSRGTVDSEGKPLKVVWSSIVVATALDKRR